MKHPIQPLEKDSDNVLRFKQEDREQFAQLIGYSSGGFSTLPYESDKTYDNLHLDYERLILSAFWL